VPKIKVYRPKWSSLDYITIQFENGVMITILDDSAKELVKKLQKILIKKRE